MYIYIITRKKKHAHIRAHIQGHMRICFKSSKSSQTSNHLCFVINVKMNLLRVSDSWYHLVVHGLWFKSTQDEEVITVYRGVLKGAQLFWEKKIYDKTTQSSQFMWNTNLNIETSSLMIIKRISSARGLFIILYSQTRKAFTYLNTSR